MLGRVGYFWWTLGRSLSADGNDKTCPSCGGTDHRLVARKYLTTALLECSRCMLRFRTPKDDPQKAEEFYADEVYKQGFTTDLPADDELKQLLAAGFAGTEKDFGHRIEALQASGLQPGARILDFGCSWGYGSWQLRQAGYEVYSYEIGRQRARYAREKLNCTMADDLGALAGSMDCFFSSHVIEHLANPRMLFELAERTLRPGGLFVCYCPNGAIERERRDPGGYHANWGQVHPLMITPAFLQGEADRRGFAKCKFYSSPHAAQPSRPMRSPALDGDELLMIGRTAATGAAIMSEGA